MGRSLRSRRRGLTEEEGPGVGPETRPGAALREANIPGGGHSTCKARRQETAQRAWGTLQSSGGGAP